MRYFFLYALLARILRQPLLVLFLLFLVYLLIDRRFIGLLPDLGRPFRRRRHMARLTEEIMLNPANARGQLELGQLYLERGDIRKALPLLEKARERMADTATALALLGACCYRLGRDDQAREALTKAVAINPKVRYGEPYYYLLAMALRAGQMAGEETSKLKERILAGGSAEIFYRSGRVLLRAGDREGAQVMFREVIENYRAVPKRLRRAYRRWALVSWIFLQLGGG